MCHPDLDKFEESVKRLSQVDFTDDSERFLLKEYLGDAVYALWDGSDIFLRINDHRNAASEICLEPEVMAALSRFADRCAAEKTKDDKSAGE